MPDHTETADASSSARPGRREILIGLGAFAVVELVGLAAVSTARLDPMTASLILTALPGLAGLAGFAAAFVRLRSWETFGVRSTAPRWIVAGLGLGLGAFVLKGLFVVCFILSSGPRDALPFGAAIGDSSGLWAALVATLLLGVLGPVGEELLFRGVVTNGLLRYGPVVGVVGGAALFAVLHGMTVVLPAAVFAGLAAGELFRRSGSVWPAVALHVMFALPTVPAMLLASAIR